MTAASGFRTPLHMTFSTTDLHIVGTILREAARAEILPRFRNLAADAVRHKTGPLDLVTDADEAAERSIANALATRFPDATVLGEEACSATPALLARLPQAELAFVIDPVDGTANFAAGLPLFGVMAAAIRHGEVVASAIHDPICDDTAFALRGAGAWIEHPDGSRANLHVAAPAPASEMAGNVSWRFMPEPQRQIVCGNLPRLGRSWDYRCAAHEYRMASAGYCHFLVFNRLLPWDHAPGWLLHQEAGGYAARLDGSPYTPKATNGGLICAPDRASWQALHDTLLGIA